MIFVVFLSNFFLRFVLLALNISLFSIFYISFLVDVAWCSRRYYGRKKYENRLMHYSNSIIDQIDDQLFYTAGLWRFTSCDIESSTAIKTAGVRSNVNLCHTTKK